jgi:hypothetical protein
MSASVDAPAAMTEIQAATLARVVTNLRRRLPDPSARDIYDAIAEFDEPMSRWATANRVKKLNTQLNKQMKALDGSKRTGDEPDETNGPLVLEDLLSKRRAAEEPDGASLKVPPSLFLHLAAVGDSRIFSHSEHHKATENSNEDVRVGLAFRRSLVQAAKMHDEKVMMWRCACADESSGAGSSDETSELVVVCKNVFTWRNEKESDAAEVSPLRCVFEVRYAIGGLEKNAHKRNLEQALRENAGAVGTLRMTKKTRDVWIAHLTRNRHYEDKYSGKLRGGFWEREILQVSNPSSGEEDQKYTQSWENSYVVTPNPAWFR